MVAGCTVNKKPQCLAQQAKLGTQKQSSVSTQAHKLIYAELMRPHFLLGPFCSVDAFKLSILQTSCMWVYIYNNGVGGTGPRMWGTPEL